jgi:hypothetical protein
MIPPLIWAQGKTLSLPDFRVNMPNKFPRLGLNTSPRWFLMY